MSDIEAMAGEYKGEGRWYDSAGNVGTYDVMQTVHVLPAGIEISFRHDFDDGTVTEARLMLNQVAPYIYRVAMLEHEVGYGSWLGAMLHYHIEAGGKFVEVGYRPSGGDMLVSGSSTKNRAGNYIAWTERLERAART
jgi:hypothetical protein